MAIRCDRTLFQHVNVPAHADLRSTSFTVGAEFRPRATPATDEIYCILSMGHNDTTTKGNYYLDYQDVSGTPRLRLGYIDTGSTARGVAYDVTLTVGRTYSIVGTFDNTSKEIKLFLAILADVQGQNGETSYTEVATDTLGAVSPFASTEALRIGAGVTSAGAVTHVANADISGAFVHTAEVSKATLDARLGTVLDGTESDLEAYWRLDDGLAGVGGLTAYDRSGNGHDGTFKNSALWAADPIDIQHSTGIYTKGIIGWHNGVTRNETSITASSAASGYPDEELLNSKQARTTRTANVSGAKTWVFDLGRPVPVSLITIDGHNLTSKAIITYEAHTADSWGGPDLAAVTVTYHPSKIRQFTARPWSYRYWRLSITDSTNGDSYIELGAVGLWVCWEGYFTPIQDTVALLDPSVSVETQHRQRTTRAMTKSAPVGFTFSRLHRQQADELHRIMENVGGGGYVFACAEPARRLYELGVYGPLLELPDRSLHDPQWNMDSLGGIVVEADFK